MRQDCTDMVESVWYDDTMPSRPQSFLHLFKQKS